MFVMSEDHAAEQGTKDYHGYPTVDLSLSKLALTSESVHEAEQRQSVFRKSKSNVLL